MSEEYTSMTNPAKVILDQVNRHRNDGSREAQVVAIENGLLKAREEAEAKLAVAVGLLKDARSVIDELMGDSDYEGCPRTLTMQQICTFLINPSPRAEAMLAVVEAVGLYVECRRKISDPKRVPTTKEIDSERQAKTELLLAYDRYSTLTRAESRSDDESSNEGGGRRR